MARHRERHGEKAAWPARLLAWRAGALTALLLLLPGGLWASPVWALSEAYRAAWNLVDGESLRWLGIHRQETSRTCGPATLVTLLTYYYGFPVSEQEAARRALGLGPGEVPSELLAAPASMRGLRDALRSWGYAAYGVKMSLEGLEAYLREQARPLVVRIAHPEPHFTLLTGIVQRHVLMADSALGWRALPLEELARIWDGYGLLVDHPLPSPSFPSPSSLPSPSPVPGSALDGTDRPSLPVATTSLRQDERELQELRGRLEHLQRGLRW